MMKELIRLFFYDYKMIIAKIIVFVILFFVIFFLKNNLEKEKSFIKKINKRFYLKYLILIMLVIGIVFVLISYVIAIMELEIGKRLLCESFLFLFLSVEWAFVFDKINIYSNILKKDIIDEYLHFLGSNHMSDIKYSEVITWFSRWNHNSYLQKNNYEQESNNIILKLELLLRPNEKGLCKAYYHKNIFKELCKEIYNKSDTDKVNAIINLAEELENTPPEKYKLFSLVLDHNILTYFIIICVHIVASVLVSDFCIKDFMGNLLFYLPSDILIILVYKGIVREK